MMRQYGGGGNDWTVAHDGNGNWVRVNQRTGDVQPFQLGAQQGQGQVLLNPGDPQRARYNIPNDGRTWQIDQKTGKAEPIAGNAQPYEQEAGVRKEFETNEAVKQYRQSATAYDQMVQSANAGTGAGDVSLIYQYMKMLDPGSAVREGEFALAGQTQGVPDRIVGLYNNLVNGQRLSDNQRSQFVNLGGALQQSRYAQVNQQADFYRNVARSKGIDPKLAVNLPEYKYEKWEPPIDPATGQRRAHTGQETDPERAPTHAGSSRSNPLELPNKGAANRLPKGTWVIIKGDPDIYQVE